MNSDFDSVDIERFSEELLSKYSDGMYKMILEPFEDKFTENLNIIFLSVGDVFAQIPYSLLKSNKSDQYFLGIRSLQKILLALTHWNLKHDEKDNLTFLGIGNPYLNNKVKKIIMKMSLNFIKKLFRGSEIADRNILRQFEPFAPNRG